MSPSAARGYRRPWAVKSLVFALSIACLVALGSQLGRLLYVQDSVERTDALVVLSGAITDRWLEAVDLFREGHAPRIVLSPGARDGGEQYLRARGIVLPNDAERQRDVMIMLGVPAEAIVILPAEPDNTAQEAAAFRRLAAAEGWRRVTIVTSKLHTRRARFAFARELAKMGLQVFVRGSRYDRADPAHWWRRREDVREVFIESVKLVAYSVGLGE